MARSEAQRGSLVDLVGQFNAAVAQARAVLDQILSATRADTAGKWESKLQDLNAHVWVEAHSLVVAAAAGHFNAWARATLAHKDDREDYAWKKQIASDANQFARSFGVAFRAAGSDAPCVLFAVGSRDKCGRYVLEDRTTKTRTGSYKSLSELLPVALVSAPARAEAYTPVSPEWCIKARPVTAAGGEAGGSMGV